MSDEVTPREPVQWILGAPDPEHVSIVVSTPSSEAVPRDVREAIDQLIDRMEAKDPATAKPRLPCDPLIHCAPNTCSSLTICVIKPPPVPPKPPPSCPTLTVS
jgi:hypothetical protein